MSPKTEVASEALRLPDQESLYRLLDSELVPPRPMEPSLRAHCRACIEELSIVEARLAFFLVAGAWEDPLTTDLFFSPQLNSAIRTRSMSEVDTIPAHEIRRNAAFLCSVLLSAYPRAIKLVSQGEHDARAFLELVLGAGTLLKHELKQVNDSLSEIEQLRSEYSQIKQEVPVFQTSDEQPFALEKFTNVRAQHRQVFSMIAARLENLTWFSPAATATISPERGPLQPARASTADYARSSPEGLLMHQKRLFLEYGLNERISSLHLTGGGMQAFHLVSKVLQRAYSNLAPAPILAQPGIYWEVNEATQRFPMATTTIDLDYSQTEHALAQILKAHPSVVVVAPAPNSPIGGCTDIAALLKGLSSISFQQKWQAARGSFLTVVVDNSTLGVAAKWKNFDFTQLPETLIVVSLESMLKLHQDGFDYAPSGSLIWWSHQKYRNLFAQLTVEERMGGGLYPTPNTLCKLALAPSVEYLNVRIDIAALNALVLSQKFEKMFALFSEIRTQDSIPPLHCEVLGNVQPSHREISAPIVYFGLSPKTLATWGDFWGMGSATPQARFAIEDRLIQLMMDSMLLECGALRTQLGIGTSFGFDFTRLSKIVYLEKDTASGTANSRVCIRVATGIEDPKSFAQLMDGMLLGIAKVRARSAHYDDFRSIVDGVYNRRH